MSTPSHSSPSSSTSRPSASGADAGTSANQPPTLLARAGHQGVRATALLAGLGLLVGFFLPWLRFGDVAKFSGLSLMVSSGTAIDALTGPARGMLIVIPVCGAALIASAVLAPRLAGLAALVSGGTILGFGLLTIAGVFVKTVGVGMWLVVVSALVAAGVGAVAVARGRAVGE